MQNFKLDTVTAKIDGVNYEFQERVTPKRTYLVRRAVWLYARVEFAGAQSANAWLRNPNYNPWFIYRAKNGKDVCFDHKGLFQWCAQPECTEALMKSLGLFKTPEQVEWWVELEAIEKIDPSSIRRWEEDSEDVDEYGDPEYFKGDCREQLHYWDNFGKFQYEGLH